MNCIHHSWFQGNTAEPARCEGVYTCASLEMSMCEESPKAQQLHEAYEYQVPENIGELLLERSPLCSKSNQFLRGEGLTPIRRSEDQRSGKQTPETKFQVKRHQGNVNVAGTRGVWRAATRSAYGWRRSSIHTTGGRSSSRDIVEQFAGQSFVATLHRWWSQAPQLVFASMNGSAAGRMSAQSLDAD